MNYNSTPKQQALTFNAEELIRRAQAQTQANRFLHLRKMADAKLVTTIANS